MTEGPSAFESVMITVRRHHRCACSSGLVIASVLAIAIGVLVRYYALLRPAGAADHHAARRRCRRSPGCRWRSSCSASATRRRSSWWWWRCSSTWCWRPSPDRRRQPQPDQRRAHHGRDQAADLCARHRAGDPARHAAWCCGMNLFGAWMVVLIAESTGVGYGMGQVIMLARNTFNPSLVFFTIARDRRAGLHLRLAAAPGAAAHPVLAARHRGEAAWPLSAAQPFSSKDAVVCRGVGKTWAAGTKRAHEALRDIDLDIEPGEFVVFLGPVGLRQEHLALSDRRARGRDRGPDLVVRRPGRDAVARAQPDLPGDLAVSLADGLAERELRAGDPRRRAGRAPRRRAPRRCSASA